MKRVILLGAGFAQSYGGPSTVEITNDIIRIHAAKYIYRKLRRYAKYRTEPNFEDILAAIKLSERALNDYSGYYKTIFRFRHKKDMADVERLQTIVLDRICCLVAKRDKARKHDFDDLFAKYFSGYDGETRIYSLNYDRVPIELLQERGIPISDIIGNSQQAFSNAKISFCNLHGSIFQASGILGLDPPYIQKLPRRVIASHHLYDYRYSNPIISGRSKEEIVLSSQFVLNYASFVADILSADKIDIIGYSFGDNHINSVIEKACYRKRGHINIVDFSTLGNEEEMERATEGVQGVLSRLGNIVFQATSNNRIYKCVNLSRDFSATMDFRGAIDFIRQENIEYENNKDRQGTR